MTLAVKETIYTQSFKRDLERSAQPQWLKDLRQGAFEYFEEIGFPTVRDEDWKYTNVAALAKADLTVSVPPAVAGGLNERPVKLSSSARFGDGGVKPPATAGGTDLVFEEAKESVLVFRNGSFCPRLSNLKAIDGAAVLSFSEAVLDKELGNIFKAKLESLAKGKRNGFTALNTAFIDQGAFLYIPKNVRIEAPIQLLFTTDGGKASFPRILVVAGEFSEATIVETYSRFEEAVYLTNSIIEVSLADEAKLKHFRIQRESGEAFHIGSTKAELGRGSFYDSTNINLGGKLARHDINVEFKAEGGEAFVDGLYMLSGDQHADTHSLIEHNLPNCVSHQNYKGVMNDRSRAVFNGKVYVAEGARGTDAFQSNKNLLLSNDARVDTKPQLEIYNDDVKCAHGATVGQLEEEELFYLLSRGLNEDLARNLLTYGFAEEVINKIEIESIKRQLDEAVLSRLHAELEA